VPVARSQIQFLEQWYEFLPGQGEVFLEELKRELSSGHLLESLELVPLGHSGLPTMQFSRLRMVASSRFTSLLVAAPNDLRCLALAFTQMRMTGFIR
jgi:hypothetical protein